MMKQKNVTLIQRPGEAIKEENMAGILKVTPEKLTQAANEFANSGKNINMVTSEMMGIVDSLKQIWQGSAASEYSERFSVLREDIEKINRIIDEHVNDLNQMAIEYQSAEDQSVEESSKLLNDIVN